MSESRDFAAKPMTKKAATEQANRILRGGYFQADGTTVYQKINGERVEAYHYAWDTRAARVAALRKALVAHLLEADAA